MFRFLYLFCIALSLSLFLFTGSGSCLELRSDAFEDGGDIPVRYTCLGEDVSPGLNWSDVPAGTQSFVLIVDDPDAPFGTWVHWVAYDIPKDAAGLKEDVPKKFMLDNGTRQGFNSFRRIGYGGPCPPPGRPHRYVFRLYALDTVLRLGPGAGKGALTRAMRGHVLNEARLTGRFGRKKARRR